jgi:kynureninase
VVEETVCGAFVVSEHSNTQTDFEHATSQCGVEHVSIGSGVTARTAPVDATIDDKVATVIHRTSV